jgi:hypothetical protein
MEKKRGEIMHTREKKRKEDNGLRIKGEREKKER